MLADHMSLFAPEMAGLDLIGLAWVNRETAFLLVKNDHMWSFHMHQPTITGASFHS